ncbi:hypothetical protein [Paenibacillus mendelii]|uniref:Uncharacterized protein n=1 Tax=Paenibacillus mendelii TaxID=206163 RepID=A0ABV6JL50_9BACL|nr:hypothetical protein [Paenibacillus mendelii]MCQ6562338.1 hypothetical protein [Paenibacillus mendelii]
MTHFYELASWASGQLEDAVFLSPERTPMGSSSYKLSSQEPSPTSYGEDLYDQIIGQQQ